MSRTYALISLGCPKNLVDSERMAGLLERDGYRMVADPDGADLVIVNTCGFIGDARKESHEAIEEMLRLKAPRPRGQGDRRRLPGRARQRDAVGKIPRDRPIVGVFARDEIACRHAGADSTMDAGLPRAAWPCSGRRRAAPLAD